jgi:glutamate dehydrogenase
MRKGTLSRPDRNVFLAEMTDDVAALVLSNNYDQTLALSLAERRGLADLPHQRRFMAMLEAKGQLDREVETLPSDAALAERAAKDQPLTRAELGVLLAYAKIVLFTDIVESDLPDEAHFKEDLLGYFPDRMAQAYETEIEGHRLRREIIATVLANDVINRGGPSFVSRLQDVTACGAAEVVASYSVVRDGFDMPGLFGAIDALDSRVDGQAQLGFYQAVVRLINAATHWDLKNGDRSMNVGERAAELRRARSVLEPILVDLLPAFMRARLEGRLAAFEQAGAPADLAARLAFLDVAEIVPDIDLVARAANVDLPLAAKTFLAVTDAIRIGRIEDAARSVVATDYYDGLALSRANDMIGAARRGMSISVLAGHRDAADPVDAWIDAGGRQMARARERLQALTESGDISVSRLTVAAGIMTDLAGQ